MVLRAISNLSPIVPAKKFFLAFAWVLSRVSPDESEQLQSAIFERVKECLEFTSSDEIEVATWFLASWTALMVKLGKHKKDKDV